MYNQYLSAQPFEAEPVCSQPQSHCEASNKTPAGAGGLLQNLFGRLGECQFDTNTLIAIAVIWFLLSDGEVVDTDLLIIIAVLLLLGL